MKKIAILSLALLFLAGCGSKKKISSFTKGYEVTRNTSKVETGSKTTQNENRDISRTETTDTYKDITRIIERIFDTSGRVMAERETSFDRSTISNEKQSTETGSTSTVKTDTSVSTNENIAEAKTETKDTDLNRKSSNPVWIWVGFALFVCLVGFFAYKLIFKR